jgi:hypothetical protein
MSKILTYISFLVACAIVILAFATAQTYTQLIIAVVLYPPLVYFAFKVFPGKSRQVYSKPEVADQPQNADNGNLVDTDKRAFLKLIGVSGLSILIYSLFLKRSNIPFFESPPESGTVTLQDAAGNKINPAEKEITDDYRITEIDDSIVSYYGFTHKDGSWFIMQEDTETGSFRYVRGDADFSGNWTNRENFKYDYFINVF